MPLAASTRAETDRATEYAIAVVEGAVVAGRPVRWACERHLRDLETAHERGFYWSPADLEHFMGFARLTRHYKGPFAGRRFEPDDWQWFALGSIFGWRRIEGDSRRYLRAYLEVARKNGKSFSAAVVGLYCLAADDESGAEVYSAATKRAQARIIHKSAISLRNHSPELRRLISLERDMLYVGSKDENWFVPLGRDSKTEDGLNPSCALIDEVHAHVDSSMVDVLRSGMGSRISPLLFYATTAGTSRASYGFDEHSYFRRLVDPNSGVNDDESFAYIAQLDRDDMPEGQEDDPWDESKWIKANPGLGSSVRLAYMRSEALVAKQSQSHESNFFCKNLNVWVTAGKRWLSMSAWDQCNGWAV